MSLLSMSRAVFLFDGEFSADGLCHTAIHSPVNGEKINYEVLRLIIESFGLIFFVETRNFVDLSVSDLRNVLNREPVPTVPLFPRTMAHLQIITGKWP